MAKRVFEVAREMGVTSKAILDKCQAEGIPNMQNHMSAISAGLEATIREWFAESEQTGSTAVETAQKVDIEKVRAPAKAKAKARSKAKSDAEDSGSATATAVETLPPPPADVPPPAIIDAPAAPAAPARRPAPSIETTEFKPPSARPREVAVAPPSPTAPAAPASRPAEPLVPAASATAAPVVKPEAPHGRPGTHGPGHAPGAGGRPHSPRMNVPDRPKVISPAGPKLDVQTPAKLSGPKVVRVEAPDIIDVPKGRRPASDSPMPMNRPPRSGAGAGAGPVADDDAGSSRRNKRRAGPGAPAARGGPSRRSGLADAPPDFNSAEWRAQDLIEREARLSRSEGFLRQRRRDQKLKDQTHRERAATPAEIGGKVKITVPFNLKDLSAATGIKGAEISKKLFMKGIMTGPNAALDPALAQEIMIDYDIELELVEAQSAEAAVAAEFESRASEDVRPRSPVVTILGHVDHGKTSLLDRIRNTNIAATEAGGITQSTRAFRVPVHMGDEAKSICFLDTPGHQAFSEMRARGANMTDIVVLVISAADGVMPQTLESISHAKAAKVPVVVALNKIDLPSVSDAMVQQILGRLAEQGLNPSEWGGDTDVIRTSAVTGQGIQDLLEALDYRAQLLDLKAGWRGPARGVVIEARLEEGRGSVANLLVQEGELKVGDIIVAGRAFGRVRDIVNDKNERVLSAHPSTPVLISGLDELPDAGDKFYIVDSLRKADEAADQRRQKERERELATPKVTLDSMFAQLKDTDVKELRIVLKADVQGSVDVIKNSVQAISTDAVKVRVLHAAAGGITESDIALAAASQAVVLGFNVIPSSKARQLAEQKGVEVRSYQVIYDIVDDMKKAAEGLLEPELRQEVLGHAEVRKVFKVTRVGAIAGCYVTDGTIERNAFIRVTRSDVVIENNRVLEQLKRFKDDVKEVRSGQECGMKIVGYDDIKEGDVLECYRNVEVRRSL